MRPGWRPAVKGLSLVLLVLLLLHPLARNDLHLFLPVRPLSFLFFFGSEVLGFLFLMSRWGEVHSYPSPFSCLNEVKYIDPFLMSPSVHLSLIFFPFGVYIPYSPIKHSLSSLKNNARRNFQLGKKEERIYSRYIDRNSSRWVLRQKEIYQKIERQTSLSGWWVVRRKGTGYRYIQPAGRYTESYISNIWLLKSLTYCREIKHHISLWYISLSSSPGALWVWSNKYIVSSELFHILRIYQCIFVVCSCSPHTWI